VASLISGRRTAIVGVVACGVAAVASPAVSAAAPHASTAVAPLTSGQVLFIYYGQSGAPGQIAVANSDGSQLRVITPTGGGLQSTDIFQRPRFSPDGKHLSFTVGNTLYVADPDGSNAAKVTVTPDAGATVSFGDYEWSADSAWLYIGLTPALGQYSQLAEVRPDGSGLHSFGSSFSPINFSVAARTGEIGFPSGQKYVIFNPPPGRPVPSRGREAE
jgi:hypothetical protein